MYAPTDGWMHPEMDARMHGYGNGRTDIRWMGALLDGCMDDGIDKCKDGWMGAWMHGSIDG